MFAAERAQGSTYPSHRSMFDWSLEQKARLFSSLNLLKHLPHGKTFRPNVGHLYGLLCQSGLRVFWEYYANFFFLFVLIRIINAFLIPGFRVLLVEAAEHFYLVSWGLGIAGLRSADDVTPLKSSCKHVFCWQWCYPLISSQEVCFKLIAKAWTVVVPKPDSGPKFAFHCKHVKALSFNVI